MPTFASLARKKSLVRLVFGLAVVLNVAVAYLRTARTAPSWMIFFEDDFFYYLKVAENLSHGKGSTFNGLVATNGYHPLWLLVLTALSAVSTKGHFLLLSIVVLATLSALATYLLSAVILDEASANPLLSSALAAYVAIYALHVFYSGMEIILAVPMMLLLSVLVGRKDSWQLRFRNAFLLGLAASVTILSRLDLIIFVALLAVWIVLNRDMRAGLQRRSVFGIALGLLPVLLYFLLNLHFFGTVLPISGMAKEIRFSHFPSATPWRSIYWAHLNDWVALLPIELALLLLPFAWKSLNTSQKVLLPSLLMFQPVYVFIVSCLSDWRLWGWYRYPSRAALCGAFALFCCWRGTKKLMNSPAVALLALLLVGAQVLRADWTSTTLTIYQAAENLKTFEQTHPGIYAMGDESGMVGQELKDPVVQTEGLMMDKPYLERMQRQEPLLKALATYKVRYYVATSPIPEQGCFHAVEPIQAGASSAHMTADLCHPAVASFVNGKDVTTVYDLEKEQGDGPRKWSSTTH